jgi:alpha-L-arabinofuranosidase
MDTTVIRFDPHHPIGVVDPRIFGGFLEHLGRAVCEGIYDPTNSHADPALRKQLWGELVERAPGYAAYEKRTTREIPIVLLLPVSQI